MAQTDAGAPNVAPARVKVEGTSFEVATMRHGGKAVGNRNYVWQTLPPRLEGWQYTRTRGGIPATMKLTVVADGIIYLGNTSPDEWQGWKRDDSLTFYYSDRKKTPVFVFTAEGKAGVTREVPQSGWMGTIVLAPTIEYNAPMAPVPGTMVDYSPANTDIYIGSPSLAILPDGDYVASHDLFGPGSTHDRTRIFRSRDRGATWQRLTELDGQWWSSLFVHRGALYIMGTSREWGAAVIRRSTDGGQTWTSPRSRTTGLLANDVDYVCAPGPLVVHGGRLWRAMEDRPDRKQRRQFRAFAMSIPENADLLQADNWTFTNRLAFSSEWPGDSWLEGNIVVTPEGEVVNILRVELRHGDTAAIVRLSADGRRATFDPAHDFIAFPGGGTKFTIRFDPQTRRYWALVNKQKDPIAERNILVLTSSADLRQWAVERFVLAHTDEKFVAFQYVDWQFDGNDIIAVARTAFNGAHSFHDANYLTFHRISNYAMTPFKR